QTVVTSGGTAPVTFAVTTGALPTGLTLNASTGAISGTATAAGAYSFAVTAIDANSLTDAQTYTGTIASLLQSPSAGAVTMSVAANSTGNPVAPALSGGAATSVVIVGQPSHGTATASGLSFAYTPAPGFSGSDSFTYTATNAAGTSSPALVTIAVSAPTLILAPTGALAGGTVGLVYAQTLSASRGTGPYVYAVSGGALPAGLTVDPATVAVSGTPTTAGSYAFDILVTDVNGATGTAAYTIVIAPAPLAAPNAGAVSITVAANSADNPVAPALSGGAATSVAIAGQPAHGAATVSGLLIVYTPAAGFSGVDSFTYTAANAAGVSPPGLVTITVTAPTLVLTPAGGLPDGMAEAAYAQTLTVSGGASPYHFAVTSGAPPPGLTLNAASGAISGTPTTAGSYGFQVTATDANGATGSSAYTVTIAPAPPVAADSTSATVPANTQTEAGQNVSLNLSTLVTGDVTEVRIVTQPQHGTVTLSQTLAMRGGGGLFMMAIAGLSTPSQFVAVYTPDKDFQGVDSFAFVAVGPGGVSAPAVATITVVGRPPTAKALAAATTDGKTVSIELTTGATDGPFTGATLGAVTPADAATVALVQGGTASARTFRLDVTPEVRFGGTIKIDYTLTNVFGDSSTATVTIQVTARPNPAADPVVQGISDAQGEAARRFAQAQVDNFMRRAERLHGADCLASGNGVTLSAVDMDRTDDPRGRVGGPAPDGVNRASDGSNGGAASNAEASAAVRGCRPGDASVWTSGAISLSTRDASGDASKIRATSSGLSLGVDKRVSERASVGIGVGYGEDRSRVGGDAGRVSAQSTVVAAYGSLAPADGLFIDGMVARGWLDFDTRRLDPTSGVTTLGARDGRFTVAALSAGVDRRSGGLSWSPYGRLEYLSGSLDAYREQGAGIYDLRFDRRSLRSTLGVLGLRAAYERPTVAGILTTSLRAEWRHEFSGGSRQGVDYADVPGVAYYSLPALGWSREQLLIDPGLGLLLSSGWELGLDAGLRLSDGESATQARVEAKKRF
ncbi:autotransporter domain-containing protein, partial [Caulobacter hibisci]